MIGRLLYVMPDVVYEHIGRRLRRVANKARWATDTRRVASEPSMIKRLLWVVRGR